MAGAIAHHFNNLLFVVLGNIELALEMDSNDPMVRQCLKHAQDGTNRMAEISGKMLTYLGLTVKDRAKIDLTAACRQSLPLLRAMYPEAVQVEALFPEQGPDIVAHAPQIQELLHILVENARESCHDQHCQIYLTISTVEAEEIAPSHRFPLAWTPQHDRYACLQIADNGSGIAQEHLERIFDPFFSNKFLGRGMGLSLVQGILRAHEGCVTVTSTPGEGTSINVYLPLADQDTNPS
jgi:signal transduction histidine kinase